MEIYRIIYRSTAARPLGEAELERLVSQSRINNFSRNITGVLFYADEHIVQLLEGPQVAVEGIYRHLSRDPRHTSIATVYSGPAPRRLFPKWSLGYSQVAGPALDRLASYLDPRRWSALLPRAYDAQEVIADLLQEFVAEHQMVLSRAPGNGPPARAPERPC